MLRIRWDPEKDAKLKQERGVGFEDLLSAELLRIRRHPGRSGQMILLCMYQDYVWIVPFVIHGEDIFLKTLYPSRKFTRAWRERPI